MRNDRQNQASKPKPLSELMEKACDRLSEGNAIRAPQVSSERLQAIFGLGDQPRLTLALYAKLERQSKIEGPEFTKIVSTVIRSARTARIPRNYFAAVVTRRLREHGFE